MNPAHRSRVPILVRIRRRQGGHLAFEWYLRRSRWDEKTQSKVWYWKSWRGYVAHSGMTWKQALAEYRDYAHYWRTGDY